MENCVKLMYFSATYETQNISQILCILISLEKYKTEYLWLYL